MSAALAWLRDRIVSFFEESPGVMSSTRLVMLTLAACAAVLTFGIRTYLLSGKADAGVIGGCAGVITALLGGLAYVTGKRE